MGVFARPDSRYWWLWLEGAAKPKVRTSYVIGVTKSEKKDSRELAEREYYRRMLDLGKQVHHEDDQKAITFRKYADWYETHIIEHHRGKTRELEILETLRIAFSEFALADITREMVLEWRSGRARKTSASTSNRELAVLKHMLSTAVPAYLTHSPIARMKLLRTVKRETRVLSRDEEAKLLAVLSDVDKGIVVCALDTLMRLSDVVNLRRDQDRGTYLLVVDPKVQPYRVPVSTRLRAVLDGLPKNGPHYFARRRYDDPVITRSVIKNMLTRACKKAGIAYGREQGGITFHGLRHTGTTRMVEAGAPLRVVQEIGGWKSMRQLERYAHPTEAAKIAAVEAIGSLYTPDGSTKAGKKAKK